MSLELALLAALIAAVLWIRNSIHARLDEIARDQRAIQDRLRNIDRRTGDIRAMVYGEDSSIVQEV
jgi:hypothetical protein